MFAQKLKEVMNEMRLNATDFAATIGVSKSSVSQYLSGKHEPSDKKKEQIALALGKDADFFKVAEVDATISESNYNLPVKTAAKLMGVSPEFLYQGLQDGRFPFGYGVKMSGRWTYYISPMMLTKYTGVPVPAAAK